MDSQAKYAAVARGDAHAYLRLARDDVYREKIWDHAAGMLLVTEAGGVVTDQTGRPLDFGEGRRLESTRGILAAPPPVHATLLEALRRL